MQEGIVVHFGGDALDSWISRFAAKNNVRPASLDLKDDFKAKKILQTSSAAYMSMLEDHFSEKTYGGWSDTLVEAHFSLGGEGPYLMVCLKIMVAGSRPWFVNSSFCRLLGPLS